DPESVERLTAMLTEMMEGWTKPRSDDSIVALDPAAIAKLQALGYVIGTGVGTASSINDSLAAVHGMVDPHETRHLFDLFTTATEDIRLGRELMGISKLEKIVAKDPEFTEAIKALATAYLLHAQRPAEARVLFERTLEIDPTQDDALYFLAGILMLSGDLDGAQEHYEAALQFSPTPAPIHRELARLSMLRGDAEGARSHFERAIDANPNHIESLIALGSWHARRKEHEAAGEYFRRARNVEPNNPQVLYNIGIWYLQENDVDAAIHHLERAIAVNPVDQDAHFVLGTLYTERGEVEKARRALLHARPLASTPERRAEVDRRLEGLDQYGGAGNN
ncbi:MAG: tetratricopeptide repeat protein, partial [Gemmatimonadetes bacterium]|nr:tetratricopeptide repeat protein [Gemmatimonadota bacterium]